MSWVGRVAGLMLVMTGLGACQLIGGFDDYGPASPTGQGGGSTSSGFGGSGGAPLDHCALASPPAPSPTPGGAGDQSFVLAVRSFDLGEDPLTPGFGFDRDGACTCSNELADCPCANDVTSCRLEEHQPNHCDDERGIDANSRRIVRLLSEDDPSLASPPLTAAAEAGDWTLLFRVSGYNGEANDEEVRLAVMSSAGAVGSSTCNADARTQARWDGQDRWPINAGTLFPGSDLGACDFVVLPLGIDTKAHVVGHHLVARVSEMLILPNFGVEVRLEDVVVDFPLVADGDTWRVRQGVLSGKWLLGDILRAVAQSAERRSQPLCGVQAAEDFAMAVTCPFLDLNESAEDDRCDAASYVLRVDAEAAQLGEAVDVPPVAIDCDTLLDRECL